MREISIDEVIERRKNKETIICRNPNSDKLFHIVFPNDAQISGADPSLPIRVTDYIWYVRGNN